MITRFDIDERVREWSLREDVVEKDYVLGWLLWGIGTDETLGLNWVFKGGTCLKKCYLETYRFSEDLDFTVMPGGPVREEEIRPLLQRVLARIHEASGIQFGDREPMLKTHESGRYTQGRVYYRGPRNAPQVASIILDLSASEKIARPTVLRNISHAFRVCQLKQSGSRQRITSAWSWATRIGSARSNPTLSDAPVRGTSSWLR